MRILCVIDSLGSGGAQRQLVNLAIGFKEKGHQVRFAVYHEENFFKESLDNHHIPVDAIIEPSYLKRLLKFRKYIRSGNFDAILSFLEAANFICEFAGLPRKRWQLVVGERSANPNILKSMKLRFYRWFHLFADVVVSNSYENLKLVKKINPLLPSRKCKVIYNAVDFNIWKADPEYEPLKDNTFRLVVAASHQYLKNAKGLIEAVSRLSVEEKSRIRIDWYGDERTDNSLNEAKELVREFSLNQNFTFHRATFSIHKEMRQADAIGLFSFHEGLPNVLCEGIALSKPIIASSVSDIPLMIKEHRLLCNPKDTGDIRRALSFLVSLNEKELIGIGHQNRSANIHLFNREKILVDYLNLLAGYKNIHKP